MKPENFEEAIWLKNRPPEVIEYNQAYRNKHPEFEKFDMPEFFWYKIYPEFQVVHWAVIKQFDINKIAIYFINVNGRAFDRLILQNEAEAEKILKKSNFISSKQKKAPYLPVEPVFISLIKTKKKALYSKAGWLNYRKKARFEIYKIITSILFFLCTIICIYIKFRE